ncbi:T9SS type A sorting domain-containing protein [Epilithonimonas sp.]|uniref:T9SS type A sorting domain-containing protein n=1 Tax=Epilithonimonas sp. TaxID=2894511 RepID=UPI0035B072F1
MKKSFLFIFTVFTFSLGLGQINPIQNLEWAHYYDSSNYRNIFSLSWQEPQTPHNELIGFNIYSDNNLYRFQSVNSFGLSCNPDFGQTADCSFLTTNNGYGFTGYVAAVYAGNIESERIPFTVNGVALSVNDIKSTTLNIFPNPAKDFLNFSQEISNIKITDLFGKVVQQISNSEKSINVSKLAKGTYIISATTQTGEIIKKKFIKE